MLLPEPPAKNARHRPVSALIVDDHGGVRAAAAAAGAVAFVAKRRMHEELASVLRPLLEETRRRIPAAQVP